jgi:transcriptional regulator with XRE-family HTH domain
MRREEVSVEKTIYSDRYTRLTRRLMEARKAMNLTQAQAGKLVGVSRCWIQKVEAGQLCVDILQLRSLCHAYGVAFIELVKDVDKD